MKANPHRIFAVKLIHLHDRLLLETVKNHQELIEIRSLSRSDRYSNGSLKIDITNDGELLRAIVQSPEVEENK